MRIVSVKGSIDSIERARLGKHARNAFGADADGMAFRWFAPGVQMPADHKGYRVTAVLCDDGNIGFLREMDAVKK